MQNSLVRRMDYAQYNNKLSSLHCPPIFKNMNKMDVCCSCTDPVCFILMDSPIRSCPYHDRAKYSVTNHDYRGHPTLSIAPSNNASHLRHHPKPPSPSPTVSYVLPYPVKPSSSHRHESRETPKPSPKAMASMSKITESPDPTNTGSHTTGSHIGSQPLAAPRHSHHRYHVETIHDDVPVVTASNVADLDSAITKMTSSHMMHVPSPSVSPRSHRSHRTQCTDSTATTQRGMAETAILPLIGDDILSATISSPSSDDTLSDMEYAKLTKRVNRTSSILDGDEHRESHSRSTTKSHYRKYKPRLSGHDDRGHCKLRHYPSETDILGDQHHFDRSDKWHYKSHGKGPNGRQNRYRAQSEILSPEFNGTFIQEAASTISIPNALRLKKSKSDHRPRRQVIDSSNASNEYRNHSIKVGHYHNIQNVPRIKRRKMRPQSRSQATTPRRDIRKTHVKSQSDGNSITSSGRHPSRQRRKATANPRDHRGRRDQSSKCSKRGHSTTHSTASKMDSKNGSKHVHSSKALQRGQSSKLTKPSKPSKSNRRKRSKRRHHHFVDQAMDYMSPEQQLLYLYDYYAKMALEQMTDNSFTRTRSHSITNTITNTVSTTRTGRTRTGTKTNTLTYVSLYVNSDRIVRTTKTLHATY